MAVVLAFGKEPDGLAAAQSAFESGDYAKSLRLAEAIVSADGQRWEGQVIVAASLAKLGKAAEAKAAFDKARTAVPADKRPLVDALERQSAPQAPARTAAELDASAQLRWRKLRILGKDAQSQSDPAAKTKAMREFQADLMEFASAHPDFRDAWLAAAACALELDDAAAGWKSAQAFARLGLDKSEVDDVLLVYLKLEKKGWTVDPRQLEADFDTRLRRKLEGRWILTGFPDAEGHLVIEVVAPRSVKVSGKFTRVMSAGETYVMDIEERVRTYDYPAVLPKSDSDVNCGFGVGFKIPIKQTDGRFGKIEISLVSKPDDILIAWETRSVSGSVDGYNTFRKAK